MLSTIRRADSPVFIFVLLSQTALEEKNSYMSVRLIEPPDQDFLLLKLHSRNKRISSSASSKI